MRILPLRRQVPTKSSPGRSPAAALSSKASPLAEPSPLPLTGPAQRTASSLGRGGSKPPRSGRARPVVARPVIVGATAASPLRSEGETRLIAEAARAGTRDHWAVGAAAAQWLAQFAAGRGEAEFSAAVNEFNPDADFSPDYVRRCRNVYTAFPQRVGRLSWSHHLRALEGTAGNRAAAADWLARAEAQGWSVRALLSALDSARAAAAPPDEFDIISGDGLLEPSPEGSSPPFDPDDDDSAAPNGRPRSQTGLSPADDDELVELPALNDSDDPDPPAGRPEKTVNDKVTVPPPREAVDLASPGPLLAEDASPEQVGRWLVAVLEQPSLLIHHQVLRRPQRFAGLPAPLRQTACEALTRLAGTLTRLETLLKAPPTSAP